ncbi:MAG: zinc ABC transporter substrate-binding protein [Dehalococcoidia bacterium]
MALVALAMFTAACGDDSNDPAGSGRLRVVATTVQIAALTREVGGDRIDLTGLIPAGADAHEFEPVASDLTAIEGAALILRHGIGIDDWLDDTLSASDARVVTVTDGIDLQRGALEDDAEPSDDDHGKGAFDPHVWHDPDNAKVMVRNIADALADADAPSADAYRAAADGYSATLDATKAQIQDIIGEIPPENRKLVTNHDAFGYFARAFGLQIVGAVIPGISTQAEPSARQTAALLDTIERERVKAIFAESSASPGLAEQLARDAGVTIVDDLYGDSLGEPGSSADTIDGMLLANARKIADALK